MIQQQSALTPQEILHGLSTRVLGQKIDCLSVTDSTNTEVKKLAESGAPDGSTVTAEHQTGGKGRLGRVWDSPPTGGLYFTVLLRGKHLPEPLTNITLLAGLAVCTALRELFCVDARIKWPNDIVVDSKKICGILAEAGFENGRISWAAVGIGINVNNTAFPEELAYRATSLLLETGKPQSRCTVLQQVLEKFEPLLEAGILPQAYTDLCISLDKQVSFTQNRQTFMGQARGITPDGELLVVLPDNSTVAVGSGEVVVQGIYGEKV